MIDFDRQVFNIFCELQGNIEDENLTFASCVVDEEEEFEEYNEGLRYYTMIFDDNVSSDALFCILYYENGKVYLTNWDDKKIELNEGTKDETIMEFMQENLK